MAARPATLEFVEMQPAHLPDVLRNETRSYAFPWTNGIFTDCLKGAQECWVASYRGTVVGHAVFTVAVGDAHLLNLCIGRDQQGSGYGRQFMAFILQHCRALGASDLYLEVRPSNWSANALYESLGFREIGVRKEYYPAQLGREDARVLALALDASTQVPSPKDN